MKSLSDICELIVDCEHKTAPTQEQGYPSIRTPNIGRGYFILNGVNRVSEETYKLWTRRATPQGGDLILAREAPVGNVAVIPEGEQYCLGQRTVLIRPKKDIIEPNYLCFLLLSPGIQGELLGKSSGATVHHLNIKDIRALGLPNLPSLKKQKQISLTIKRYDELITTNQRRIALLEEAARLIYREWFVNLRFPGHDSTPMSDGEPEGWTTTTLGNVCTTLGGGTPSTKISEYWNGNVTWVTPTDLTRNNSIVLLDSEKKISESGLKNSSAKLLPPETILMTSRASIGYFALMDYSVCTNQGFISIIPEKDHSRMYLLFNLMNRIEEMTSLATGSTFKELSKRTFRSLPILWPTDEILEKFNNSVYPMIQQIRVIKKQNSQLAQARDLLLPKLMSGQIDVSNIQLSDEDVVT